MKADEAGQVVGLSHDNWLLPFLALVRIRPGMFMGDERVESLQLYMAAYGQARADLGFVGMSPEDWGLLEEFRAWLVEETKSMGPPGSRHWLGLVKRIDDGSKSVHTFFKLFEEFLQTTGRSLDKVALWSPVGMQPGLDPSKGS